MKPTKAIVSCNDDPFYREFWEPVSRAWANLGIEPVLAYIGKNPPAHAAGTVIQIDPVHDVAINTQAQWGRFHFTQTELDTVWIVSDIDMIPCSRSYFIDLAEPYPDGIVINTNPGPDHYLPACYNIGTGSAFKRCLNMPDNFNESLALVTAFKSRGHRPAGKDELLENWFVDELYLGSRWEWITPVTRPGGFCSRRIDRIQWQYDPSMIQEEYYHDCHSLRPYGEHKDAIEKVIELVKSSV